MSQSAISVISQPPITCSKLTIKTLEKGVKYVQRQCRRSDALIINLEHMAWFWCFYG